MSSAQNNKQQINHNKNDNKADKSQLVSKKQKYMTMNIPSNKCLNHIKMLQYKLEYSTIQNHLSTNWNFK
jgi:hypothetical protein